jgi:CheY-like chemotaxis protein
MTSDTQNVPAPPETGESIPPAADAAPNTAAPETAEALTPAIDWANTRVMLLDDEDEDGDLIVKCLAQLGITKVTWVKFAARAYYQLAEDREVFPDILILETVLAGTNGLQLLARLRTSPDEQMRNLPAVVITSQDAPNLYRRATNQNISGYLRKPVALGKLREALVRAKEGKFLAADIGRSWIDDVEGAKAKAQAPPKPKFWERVLAALFFRKKP